MSVSCRQPSLAHVQHVAQHLPLLFLRSTWRHHRPRHAAAWQELPRCLSMACRRAQRDYHDVAHRAVNRYRQAFLLRRQEVYTLLRASRIVGVCPQISLRRAQARPARSALVPTHQLARQGRHQLTPNTLLRHRGTAGGHTEPQSRPQHQESQAASIPLSARRKVRHIQPAGIGYARRGRTPLHHRGRKRLLGDALLGAQGNSHTLGHTPRQGRPPAAQGLCGEPRSAQSPHVSRCRLPRREALPRFGCTRQRPPLQHPPPQSAPWLQGLCPVVCIKSYTSIITH